MIISQPSESVEILIVLSGHFTAVDLSKNFGEIYRDTQGTTPQISVNTRSSCGKRDCIL